MKTKYRNYTPPKNIRPGTRKAETYKILAVRGEGPALEQNARRKNPIKEVTMRSWINHAKYIGECRP